MNQDEDQRKLLEESYIHVPSLGADNFCGCRLIWLIFRYQDADNLYADIGEEVLLLEFLSREDEDLEESEIKQTMDFLKLLSINEGIEAWISIPTLE